MKLVLNGCYGGFSLSHEGHIRYAELAGFQFYPYVQDLKTRRFVPYEHDPDDETHKIVYYFTTEAGRFAEKEENKNRLNWNHCFCDRNLERDDPILIKVVEELGEKANGPYAELHIVEIPDGINWEIDAYDGLEKVVEKHRSWW